MKFSEKADCVFWKSTKLEIFCSFVVSVSFAKRVLNTANTLSERKKKENKKERERERELN